MIYFPLQVLHGSQQFESGYHFQNFIPSSPPLPHLSSLPLILDYSFVDSDCCPSLRFKAFHLLQLIQRRFRLLQLHSSTLTRPIVVFHTPPHQCLQGRFRQNSLPAQLEPLTLKSHFDQLVLSVVVSYFTIVVKVVVDSIVESSAATFARSPTILTRWALIPQRHHPFQAYREELLLHQATHLD